MSKHPDFEGPLFVGDVEEDSEFWVHTGECLTTDPKGVEDYYAKIRVVETRTVHKVDTETNE